MALARLLSEVDGLLRGGTHARSNRIVAQVISRKVEASQAVIDWLTGLGTLIRWEIDGSRREVDSEGDDAGNEEEKQSHCIERDNAPVDFSRGLAAPFGVENCSAACRAGCGDKKSQQKIPATRS